MNADTVQHGSFFFTVAVIFFLFFVLIFYSFFLFFFVVASLSRYNTIHKYDSKIQYLQVWLVQRGRHIRKENSLKVWVFLEKKQSPPVRSRSALDQKLFPGLSWSLQPF